MTLNKKKPSPLIKKKSPPKARKQSFEEDRPIQVRNQNPYENFEEEDQYKQKNGDEPQPLSK